VKLFIVALLVAGCGSSSPAPAPAPPSGPEASAPPAPDAASVVVGTADATAGTAPEPDAALSPTVDARPEAPAGTVRLMVMGSSNEVRTCWRAFLWQKLRARGITSFDFVGGQADGPDCGVPGYDKDDESRNGTIVTDITAAEYTARFKAHPPDIVLVHFGGADLLQGIAPSKVIPGYTLMVMQARAVNPRIRFLVAQHTPMAPASCGKCATSVPELNAAIVEWARGITTDASPVSSVDLFTGVDPVSDTSDRVHLNDAGSQKVSDRWVEALVPILGP